MASDGVAWPILAAAWPELAIVWPAFLAALFIGLSKAGFPGLSLLSVVLLAELYGARASVGLALPLLIAADCVAYPAFLRHGSWRAALGLLPPAFVGLGLGYLLLGLVSELVVRRLIGGSVLLMVLVQAWRLAKPDHVAALAATGSFATLSGLIGGLATMVANAAGPIIQLYLLARGVPKMELVGIAARFFLLINLLKIPLNAHLALITRESLLHNALLAPAMVLGVVLGRLLLARLPERLFEAVASCGAFLAALRLLLA